MLDTTNPVVLLLIIVISLVSYKGFEDFGFFEKYKFQVNRIRNGEKIRMVSSGFLHANWMHLIFNMYALYLFGDIVSKSLSDLKFFLVYCGSLVA